MELYTLDSLLRRAEVIDSFESLIWTERFSSLGDLNLVVPSTHATRSLLKPDVMLALDESWRVMRVETTEDIRDSEGRSLLKVTGVSLEVLLDERIAASAPINNNDWTIIGTPGAVARWMFTYICRNGSVSALDTIPFMQSGTILPSGNIPEPSGSITWVQAKDSLYNAIKAVCDLYDLGFRMVRNGDTSQLFFEIYSGSDRSTRQSTLPPVVFAYDLDNLQNATELKTIAKHKNVAYVVGPAGFRIVYSPLVDATVDGFERRVMHIKSDVAAGTSNWQALMDQKGNEELAKLRPFQMLDSELDPGSPYKYGVDYNLGDLVEARNDDDEITLLRVSEQIFVSDSQGERSYPTLSVFASVTPGSWLSWGDTVEWSDWTATEYWSTMP